LVLAVVAAAHSYYKMLLKSITLFVEYASAVPCQERWSETRARQTQSSGYYQTSGVVPVHGLPRTNARWGWRWKGSPEAAARLMWSSALRANKAERCLLLAIEGANMLPGLRCICSLFIYWSVEH